MAFRSIPLVGIPPKKRWRWTYRGLTTVSASKCVAFLLFLLFFALAFRLRQRDLEFLIEPDFNWQLIEAWKDYLSTLNPNRLPLPYTDGYLDGQFILYAIADATIRWLAGHIDGLRPHFPNDLSYAFGAALLTNIAAYASACTIFFCAIYRLTARVLISALMAIGLFLAPQMIDINIGRPDFLNSLPLMITFYCSCVLAMGQARRRHAIALGVALAFAATIKINGLFFGLFPAFAAITNFRFDNATIKRLSYFVVLSAAAFLFVFAILMGRFIYYLSPLGIVEHYKDSITLEMRWALLHVGPPLYYNVDLMLEHGKLFVDLYFACAIYLLIIAVLYKLRPALFLTICFAGLSIAGIFAQKYDRGGYHLLPVYFGMIGLTSTSILSSSISRVFKSAVLAAGALIFILSLTNSLEKYQNIVLNRQAEPIGLQDLKRAPGEWLRAHVSTGTSVCVQTHTEWALPPLDDFKVTYGPLALPYLDVAALALTEPPALEELRKDCPIIVTSDWHRFRFGQMLVKASPPTAVKWEAFFKILNERYHPTVFSSAVSLYTKEIDIYDLRDDQ